MIGMLPLFFYVLVAGALSDKYGRKVIFELLGNFFYYYSNKLLKTNDAMQRHYFKGPYLISDVIRKKIFIVNSIRENAIGCLIILT